MKTCALEVRQVLFSDAANASVLVAHTPIVLLLCHTVCPDKFDASMLVTPGSAAAAAAGGAAAGGAAAGVKVTNGVVSNAPAHSAATNRLAYEMLAQHRIDVDEVGVALVRHFLAKQCE